MGSLHLRVQMHLYEMPVLRTSGLTHLGFEALAAIDDASIRDGPGEAAIAA
jgi:hypothetical protein